MDIVVDRDTDAGQVTEAKRRCQGAAVGCPSANAAAPFDLGGPCAYSMRMDSRGTPLPYDTKAGKKATNLTVNSDLLRRAREMDINLSAVLEDALLAVVKRRLRERWMAENREAIAAYNEHVEAHGVFSDGLRSF